MFPALNPLWAAGEPSPVPGSGSRGVCPQRGLAPCLLPWDPACPADPGSALWACPCSDAHPGLSSPASCPGPAPMPFCHVDPGPRLWQGLSELPASQCLLVGPLFPAGRRPWALSSWPQACGPGRLFPATWEAWVVASSLAGLTLRLVQRSQQRTGWAKQLQSSGGLGGRSHLRSCHTV